MKKDGTSRTLIATTDLTKIPEDKHPKKKVSEPDQFVDEVEMDPLFNVYDRDDGWRSFRASQLSSFVYFVGGYNK